MSRRVAGRTVVTDLSTPAPDCQNVFGIYGDPGNSLPRLVVDRRGRSAGARHLATNGIAAVRGQFHGRRPRLATLAARWHFGSCRATWGFRLRPVRRVPVRDGEWAGTHAGGGTVSFSVVNAGREAYLFTFAWSPEFRCVDGSTHRYPSYLGGSELAWIRRVGSFSLRDAEDDLLLTMQGSLRGRSGSGWFRIIETLRDTRGVCDTGLVSSPPAGRPEPHSPCGPHPPGARPRRPHRALLIRRGAEVSNRAPASCLVREPVATRRALLHPSEKVGPSAALVSSISSTVDLRYCSSSAAAVILSAADMLASAQEQERERVRRRGGSAHHLHAGAVGLPPWCIAPSGVANPGTVARDERNSEP